MKLAGLAALALCARLSGADPLGAAVDAAQAVKADGAATAELGAPPAATAVVVALDEEGLIYAFSLSSMAVKSSNPLSYTPLELGYRFSNGVQVRSGLDLFYYEAEDLPTPRTDPNDKSKQIQDPAKPYRFEMMNWRTTLCYLVPLSRRLRPLAGLSLDMVRGERSEAGKLNPPKEDAYGFIGASVVLGLEWRFADSAALGFSGRGTHSFKETIGYLSTLSLSWLYLF